MMLYLLRHGEAEPKSTTDAARRLTPYGESQVVSVATQFLQNALQIQRCISSPYARARQTAELFLARTRPDMEPEFSDQLTPDVRADQVMRMIEGLNTDRAVLVSHNPLISELYALLTAGNISNMQILATSELVAVELEVVGLGMGSTVLRLRPDGQPVTN